MSDLPESQKIGGRPVMKRLVRRQSLEPLLAPTDEEKSDALHILAEDLSEGHPLYREACRIWIEGSVEHEGRTVESQQAQDQLMMHNPMLFQLGQRAIMEGGWTTQEIDRLWLALHHSGRMLERRFDVMASDLGESIRGSQDAAS